MPDYKNFEDYLRSIHAENYMGTDDDMSDDFDHMLSGLDYGSLLLFGMDYSELYPTVKQEKLLEADRWIKILLGEE